MGNMVVVMAETTISMVVEQHRVQVLVVEVVLVHTVVVMEAQGMLLLDGMQLVLLLTMT